MVTVMGRVPQRSMDPSASSLLRLGPSEDSKVNQQKVTPNFHRVRHGKIDHTQHWQKSVAASANREILCDETLTCLRRTHF